jgi:hypothetical protein
VDLTESNTPTSVHPTGYTDGSIPVTWTLFQEEIEIQAIKAKGKSGLMA